MAKHHSSLPLTLSYIPPVPGRRPGLLSPVASEQQHLLSDGMRLNQGHGLPVATKNPMALVRKSRGANPGVLARFPPWALVANMAV